jgi:hypothetical protein
MRIGWYLLAVVLGAFGVLGVARSIERLTAGAGVSPIQILIGLIGLLLAWLCVQKARASTGA